MLMLLMLLMLMLMLLMLLRAIASSKAPPLWERHPHRFAPLCCARRCKRISEDGIMMD
jgi:hypothetical protein